MKPIEIALGEYGTKAITGAMHNPEVLKYFNEIGQGWVADDETAWCAAFVNWCMKQAGVAGTMKLNARSFMSWGRPTATPTLGDIVVLWRITREGPYGHVGFYVKQEHGRVFLLAGNQSNEVNITAFDKLFLLGYRTLPSLHGN